MAHKLSMSYNNKFQIKSGPHKAVMVMPFEKLASKQAQMAQLGVKSILYKEEEPSAGSSLKIIKLTQHNNFRFAWFSIQYLRFIVS